jgi:hypothetical protein
MFPELQYLTARIRALGARLAQLRHDERGYSTETVIVTALLAVLAIAVIGVIAARVKAKASSINLGLG